MTELFVPKQPLSIAFALLVAASLLVPLNVAAEDIVVAFEADVTILVDQQGLLGPPEELPDTLTGTYRYSQEEDYYSETQEVGPWPPYEVEFEGTVFGYDDPPNEIVVQFGPHTFTSDYYSEVSDRLSDLDMMRHYYSNENIDDLWFASLGVKLNGEHLCVQSPAIWVFLKHYWDPEASGPLPDWPFPLPLDAPDLAAWDSKYVEVFCGPSTDPYLRVLAELTSAVLVDPGPEITLECDGFGPPLDDGPVTMKGGGRQRALPLWAMLYDAEDGSEVTDADIPAPPILQVEHEYIGDDGQLVVEDVSDDAVPSGLITEGNEFIYLGEAKWEYILNTLNFTGEGKYVLTMKSGSPDYTIEPTCEAEFVRLK